MNFGPNDNFLDLTKSFDLNLEKASILQIPILATRLAVDKSSSMGEEFSSGWVDYVIQLFLVAAMKFDDDGRLEIGFFNNSLTLVRDMTEKDIKGKTPFTKAVGQYADGGTRYAPVIEGMADYDKTFTKLTSLFGKKPKKKGESYLGMITDGDCSDFNKFEGELRKVTGSFIQVIAIGNQVTLDPLRRLEKELDYISVIHLPNPNSVTHEAFFNELCNPKFKTWIDLYCLTN